MVRSYIPLLKALPSSTVIKASQCYFQLIKLGIQRFIQTASIFVFLKVNGFSRELPAIAKHYVIRLLFVEQPVPQAVIASWVSQAYAK